MTGNCDKNPSSLPDTKPDQQQLDTPQRPQTLLKYCRNNPNFLRDPASFPQTLKLIGGELASDGNPPKSGEEVLALLESWKQHVAQTEPAALQRPSDRELKRLLDALESRLTFTQITLILQHLEVVGSGSETLWPTIAVEMRALKFPARPEVYWRWGFDEWGQQAKRVLREDPDGLSALQQRYVDFLQERGEVDGGGEGSCGVDALELVINHCRACLEVLKVGGSKVYLFEALGVGTTLADKINVCFGSGINVEERLPKYVCGRCVEQVEAAYALKMQIDRTDEELRSLLAEYSKPVVEEAIEVQAEEVPVDSTESAQGTAEEENFEDDAGMDVQDASMVEEEIRTKVEPEVQLEQEDMIEEEEEDMEHEYVVVETEETGYELSEEHARFSIRIMDDDNEATTADATDNKKEPVKPAAETTTEGKSFYQCDKCRVVLRTYELLKRHEKARHNDEEERHFACSHCTKKFRSASTLKVHQRIHTNERPYVCDICDKSFAQNTNLVYHRKVHQNIRDYACDQCSYRARSQNDLNLHSRRHTGARPYVCDECQLPFSTSSNLSKHVKRRHMGERKYKCDQCDKTFTTKETAQKHLVTHTGSKPFHCPECNVAYGWYNGLQKHLKSVHPGAPIPTEKSMMGRVQEHLKREAAKAVTKDGDGGAEK
ncbi:zinc finger and SCAN domain-containing protein 2 isoform X2 [Culex quinquefasciatus]|uniref:zinc finger and SCAN domain-containing protein 2 isoform X2 n=1 Tax=Culex quinquefasciatus TaxID=7176 RepID=UPI0018E37BB9|nr:zinc finger and SCAN domain-containing protein 2 isoform X2 [Culex quinquefasciatus]